MKNEKTYLGFAQVDITPEQSVQTIGFNREDNSSRGVLKGLLAQICLFTQAGEKEQRFCLLTVDHIGFSKEHAEELRERIGTYLGIGIESVMICFSHTHSAPNESLEPEYFQFLCRQVMKGVETAEKGKIPVLAAWGTADGEIGVNRRNGGEIDRRIGILKFVSAKSGEPVLTVLRVTAHANVLKRDNYMISPDYFGTVRDWMEKRYGGFCMVTQGASGNVAPKYFCSKETPVDADDPERFIRSQTALNDMAEEVGQAVESVWSSMTPADIRFLQMKSVFFDLYADVPDIKRAAEIAEEAKREAGIDGKEWLLEVERLRKKGICVQKERIEIQYLALNEGCLCGVPNEIMCEFALRAQAMKDVMFYLSGYTNGCSGYFPTEEEYDLGGYEVWWSMLIYYRYHGRVAPLNRESASALIHTAVKEAPKAPNRLEKSRAD